MHVSQPRQKMLEISRTVQATRASASFSASSFGREITGSLWSHFRVPCTWISLPTLPLLSQPFSIVKSRRACRFSLPPPLRKVVGHFRVTFGFLVPEFSPKITATFPLSLRLLSSVSQGIPIVPAWLCCRRTESAPGHPKL